MKCTLIQRNNGRNIELKCMTNMFNIEYSSLLSDNIRTFKLVWNRYKIANKQLMETDKKTVVDLYF